MRSSYRSVCFLLLMDSKLPPRVGRGWLPIRRVSALKSSETKKPTSVDTHLLPVAVLPPLEKAVLQSRESDADAEMSSSSISEEDALEYNISEDLEDSPAVTSPPPSSKLEKANKYKNK
ncbi:hypothetical protein AVEN_233533-1 [Araneus ventricosus]|uniref:Uncharacterized protein n=1 Tax=Araneus ventricosus TaxID=182803 RepID=A0A4Y2NBB7_ARAVE|nr:hypothetical protein AVEN_233533-1 [Araneus ventricosus]